jgi:hypothetical protein
MACSWGRRRDWAGVTMDLHLCSATFRLRTIHIWCIFSRGVKGSIREAFGISCRLWVSVQDVLLLPPHRLNPARYYDCLWQLLQVENDLTLGFDCLLLREVDSVPSALPIETDKIPWLGASLQLAYANDFDPCFHPERDYF